MPSPYRFFFIWLAHCSGAVATYGVLTLPLMNIILLTYLSLLEYQMSVIRRACLATKKNYLMLKCFDLFLAVVTRSKINYFAYVILSPCFRLLAVKLKFFFRNEKLRPRR